jgi:hypothetical protein
LQIARELERRRDATGGAGTYAAMAYAGLGGIELLRKMNLR